MKDYIVFTFRDGRWIGSTVSAVVDHQGAVEARLARPVRNDTDYVFVIGPDGNPNGYAHEMKKFHVKATNYTIEEIELTP